jgi:seryl-tRNA synthetase
LLQFEDRERKFTHEIERLRTHLLKMEESYTIDLIAAEDREKSLRNQIAQLDDTNRGQNELIQQLNTSGEQSKQALATELGTLKYEHTKLETLNNNLNNQLQYQMKCSQNLQNVLEQFKRGKADERRILPSFSFLIISVQRGNHSNVFVIYYEL